MMTSLGIPLLYLGDEIGQLNDTTFLDDPDTAGDNRWMHRPRFDWPALRAAEKGVGPGAPILAGIRRLAELRAGFPNGLGLPEIIETGDPGVLAFRRRGDGDAAVLVVANLADSERVIDAPAAGTLDASGDPGAASGPMAFAAYEFRILLHGE